VVWDACYRASQGGEIHSGRGTGIGKLKMEFWR